MKQESQDPWHMMGRRDGGWREGLVGSITCLSVALLVPGTPNLCSCEPGVYFSGFPSICKALGSISSCLSQRNYQLRTENTKNRARHTKTSYGKFFRRSMYTLPMSTKLEHRNMGLAYWFLQRWMTCKVWNLKVSWVWPCFTFWVKSVTGG